MGCKRHSPPGCPAEVPDRKYPAQDVWLSRKSSRLWRGRLEAKYWSQVGLSFGPRGTDVGGACTTTAASQRAAVARPRCSMLCLRNTGVVTAWLLAGRGCANITVNAEAGLAYSKRYHMLAWRCCR